MFAPEANKNRSLFTLAFRDDDRVDLYVASESFEDFYNLAPDDVEHQLSGTGPTHLQAAELAALANRIDERMADAQAVVVGAAETL